MDLGWNGFSLEGCIALCSALASNTTLRHLELANNRINKECLVHLGMGLRQNTSLQYLGVSRVVSWPG